MNRTWFGPLMVFIGICGVIGLAAGTNVFDPIVAFIHLDAITPVQALGCILFTMLGFAACFYLLNILCNYFVPRIKAGTK